MILGEHFNLLSIYIIIFKIILWVSSYCSPHVSHAPLYSSASALLWIVLTLLWLLLWLEVTCVYLRTNMRSSSSSFPWYSDGGDYALRWRSHKVEPLKSLSYHMEECHPWEIPYFQCEQSIMKIVIICLYIKPLRLFVNGTSLSWLT